MPDTKDPRALVEAQIDETLDETFPASDPPGWTLGLEAHEHGAVDVEAPVQPRDADAEAGPVASAATQRTPEVPGDEHEPDQPGDDADRPTRVRAAATR